MSNPLSGHKSPGYRFRFQVRSIAHNILYLPLSMRQLPEIQQLFQGISPLTVFNKKSLPTARKAFYEFRKKHDFAYWAATEYHISNRNNPQNIIALHLNQHQYKIIDTFERRHFKRLTASYVISKTIPNCGVTTCVQAYIQWRQIYHPGTTSYTCTSSLKHLELLKPPVCRYIKNPVPEYDRIFIPKSNAHLYFDSYQYPKFCADEDFTYVHLANMTQWKDPQGKTSAVIFASATRAIPESHDSLLVLEGDIPTERVYSHPVLCQIHLKKFPMQFLSHLSPNPYFLRKHIEANIPLRKSPNTPFLILLNTEDKK